MTNSKNISTEKITIVRKAKKSKYSIISNSLLQDTKLSWKAKGILCYLLHLPDDWQIYPKHLEEQATDGRDSLASGMSELQKNGYLIHEKIREKGKIISHIWTVHEEPVLRNNIECKKPEPENPVMAQKRYKPEPEKPELANPQLPITNPLPMTKKTTTPTPKKSTIPEESIKSGGGSFKSFSFLENIPIKIEDKMRLSKQFSEEIVKKSVAYCTSPNFKPQKSLDASIFYFCKNPDHMTPSKEELLKKKQKDQDDENFLIERRQAFCREVENQSRKQNLLSGMNFENLHVDNKEGTKKRKVFYKSKSFNEEIKELINYFKLEIEFPKKFLSYEYDKK